METQGDLLDYLDQIDSERALDTTPGWQCPHCGNRWSERSEAEVAPAHREPYPPSPIPGACASQKIRIDLLLIRLSPARKTAAWTKTEDVLAMILEAKQVGVTDRLLGEVLVNDQLRDWVTVRQLLMATPGLGDLSDSETQRRLVERHTEGSRDGIMFRCVGRGVELQTEGVSRLVRWRDMPKAVAA